MISTKQIQYIKHLSKEPMNLDCLSMEQANSLIKGLQAFDYAICPREIEECKDSLTELMTTLPAELTN